MEKGINDYMDLKIIDDMLGSFDLNLPDIRTYSPLTLAFIGDGVYELIIRSIVVARGNNRVNTLNKEKIKYVNASAQASIIDVVMDELTPDEISVYKRGRNANPRTHAKNADMNDYRKATGFEALMGYLYLKNDLNRIFYLVNLGIQKLQIK